jgi:hypothetical protein
LRFLRAVCVSTIGRNGLHGLSVLRRSVAECAAPRTSTALSYSRQQPRRLMRINALDRDVLKIATDF